MQIYQTQAQEYLDAASQAEAKSRADRMRAFWRTLEHVLARHPVSKPTGRPFHILDLGCGVCEESRIVGAYFSTGVPGFPSATAKLHGVDADAASLQTAITLSESFDPFYYTPRYHLALDANFVLGDASHLESIAGLPDVFDFVLFRHQIVRRDAVALEQMVRQALARLAPGGMILFTSFCEEEHVALEAMLQKLPVETLVSRKNPHALPLQGDFPEGKIAIDSHVCLVKPK